MPRQALPDAKISVSRVSNKASHDYAEIFDRVPSQHDGKDAAVIAKLAGLGKVQPWGYEAPSQWDQELIYWVEWMVAQRQLLTSWQGRLETLVLRRWPEATRVLKLSTVTLLRALEHYGDPKSLAADPNATEQLSRWGGLFLAAEKPERLVEEAKSSAGVRLGEWQRRQIKEYAREAMMARQQGERAERQWRELAVENKVLEAQGNAAGIPTACVLWTSTGTRGRFTLRLRSLPLSPVQTCPLHRTSTLQKPLPQPHRLPIPPYWDRSLIRQRFESRVGQR